MNFLRYPDFLIAGAPRCGTTWLYKLLDCHPQVYMAKPLTPEPKFFLVDEIYDQGMNYYSNTWFSDVPQGKICGEKSTNYMENAKVPSRIHKHLPDVRLIFILREPGSRAFSNFLWSRMNGLEDKDFSVALDLEEEREQRLEKKKRYARPHAYFSRGLYAKLLYPWFELFPREQILCLRYEDILKNTEHLAKQLYCFLNIEFKTEDFKRLGIINPSHKAGYVMPGNIMKKLRDAYIKPNYELKCLLGSGFKVWGVAPDE